MPARAVYSATVFVSALLLFLVQPIAAVLLLPAFGGSAGVWVSAMFFFTAVLVAGYWYAHWTTVHLPAKAQIAVHCVLAAASLATLPPHFVVFGDTGGAPAIQVLRLLMGAVGLPAFVLAATSPLVQSWSARTGHPLPYSLYAVSNAGSLLALLAYPIAIDGWLSKSQQISVWSAGYAMFVLLIVGSALLSLRGTARAEEAEPVAMPQRGIWIGLAATGSVMWIGVANQLSQSVAPAPLLWIVPLSIYLLTMMLCFSEGIYRPAIFRWLFPIGLVAMGAGMNNAVWGGKVWAALALFGAGLFVCCMVCHGELYRLRPKAESLTSFYLMVAAGGALGAAFVSLLAPAIFTSNIELPAAVAACAILGLALLYGFRDSRRLARLAVVAAAALIAANWWTAGGAYQTRNFYGVLKVREAGEGTQSARLLVNGSILHGMEYLDPARTREPLTFYGERSGVGLAMNRMKQAGRRVGIIGLGAGTLATYGRAGDTFRFYELNPDVIRIARGYFQYLGQSRAAVEVVEGDARIALEREAPQNYDLLVVDAFSGDAIPVHLLTREAMLLYFRNVKPEGTVIFHVTNQYLNLEPIVRETAASIGRSTSLTMNSANREIGIEFSAWVTVDGARPVSPGAGWTDDRNSLWKAFW